MLRKSHVRFLKGLGSATTTGYLTFLVWAVKFGLAYDHHSHNNVNIKHPQQYAEDQENGTI